MNFCERCEVYFSLVNDNRNENYITYSLSQILFMVMCGIICGCKTLEEMTEVLEYKLETIQKYIKIERIPCEATFSNILKVLNVEEVELCITGICKNVINENLTVGGNNEALMRELRQFALDGKAIRSTNNHGDPENALQIVTVYDVDARMAEAQGIIVDKTNEIVAARDILKLFILKGSVVTADAIHCQKETVKIIAEREGDYIIQLKENQRTIYEDVELLFEEKITEKNKEDYVESQTKEKNGGRIETRTCYVLTDKDSLNYLADRFKDWAKFKNVFCIKREVEKNGEKSVEKSYYITSLGETPEKLMKYARNHWKIESMHWLLDVNFGEDDCPVKSTNTQRILNMIRKLALKMHSEYIEKTHPKRKTIISSIRSCALSNERFEDFLDKSFCA